MAKMIYVVFLAYNLDIAVPGGNGGVNLAIGSKNVGLD
jgi:hypothetical protein